VGTETDGSKTIHPRPPSRSVTKPAPGASPGVLILHSSLSAALNLSRGEEKLTGGFEPLGDLQVIHA